jgi:hypothetical protein
LSETVSFSIHRQSYNLSCTAAFVNDNLVYASLKLWEIQLDCFDFDGIANDLSNLSDFVKVSADECELLWHFAVKGVAWLKIESLLQWFEGLESFSRFGEWLWHARVQMRPVTHNQAEPRDHRRFVTPSPPLHLDALFVHLCHYYRH